MSFHSAAGSSKPNATEQAGLPVSAGTMGGPACANPELRPATAGE